MIVAHTIVLALILLGLTAMIFTTVDDPPRAFAIIALFAVFVLISAGLIAFFFTLTEEDVILISRTSLTALITIVICVIGIAFTHDM
jgi:hypothetical protein